MGLAYVPPTQPTPSKLDWAPDPTVTDCCVALPPPLPLRPLRRHPCSVLEDNNFTGGLPEAWGQGPAFPRLEMLGLSGSGASGELPLSWGSSGGFPSLTTLAVARGGLQGPLPKEWGSPKRFPKLAKL